MVDTQQPLGTKAMYTGYTPPAMLNQKPPDPMDYYKEKYPYGNTSSGVYNTYSNAMGGAGNPNHYYDWLSNSGLQDANQLLNNYYDNGGEFYAGLFQDLGINKPIQAPQGIDGFLSVLNSPTSGLNQIFSSGGPAGVYNFLSNKPHLTDHYGITLDQVASAMNYNPNSAGGGDPFLDFLLNQLGIAGLGQQPQPQDRFGRSAPPQIAPGYTPYQNSVNQLSSVDSLLAALLGGF